jgi:hypothetical protein
MEDPQPDSVGGQPRAETDLSSLPPHRAKAVEAWLSRPVGACSFCGEPVLPTDARVRDPREKADGASAPMHLACLELRHVSDPDDDDRQR